MQQSNPKQPTKTPGACSDLSSFECQACVTTYLNNTYGNFGGFIGSTFNAQQSIPGVSGQSLSNTLAPTAEIGLAKFGAGQGLQFGGDFIAMNTSGAGGFWLGTSLEYAGAMVAPPSRRRTLRPGSAPAGVNRASALLVVGAEKRASGSCGLPENRIGATLLASPDRTGKNRRSPTTARRSHVLR